MTEPLWNLVCHWRSRADELSALVGKGLLGENALGTSQDLRNCATELETHLKAWEAQIRDGIESRKTQTSIGPLYTMGTNQAAHDILKHILGVPSEF